MYIVYQYGNPNITRSFACGTDEEQLQKANHYAEAVAESTLMEGKGFSFVYIAKPIRVIASTRATYTHTWEEVTNGKTD